MIWYFIEGVNFRVEDDDFENENYFKIFNVLIGDDLLIFKKSNKIGRWWIELLFILKVNNKLKIYMLLFCIYGDYLSVIN